MHGGSWLVMEGLVQVAAERYTVSAEIAFIILGVGSLVVGAYAWTSRDVFAERRRKQFEKVGWTWFVRLASNDDLYRRIGLFYGIFWGVIGTVLLVAGVVLMLVPD